jgi:UDP-2,3-diacylglucosamine pyrophosphatase LpxH
MLVFISDLHFVDETAGKHNIPTAAFQKFLTSIEVHAKKARAKHLKIVFLGDIFDILRTEAWFADPKEARPWGSIKDRTEKRALAILKEIGKKNKATFDLFAPQALQTRFKTSVVETVYVPGNHDRLCWIYSTLEKTAASLLGLTGGNARDFGHHFMDIDHGVYAMHGHCLDEYNYEGGSDRSRSDYGLMPIGDPITTELIAKLPYMLMKKLKNSGMNAQQLKRLKSNFQEIENVRPFSATLSWLLYQVENNKDIKDIIEDTVDQVIRDFEKIDFVKKWYERHDRWYNPLDSADKIQGALFFLEKFKIFSTGKLLDLAKKIQSLSSGDNFVRGAEKLFSGLDNRIQHIVMGHTHVPRQKAMGCSRVDGHLREHVYLNTGTWRRRYHECEDGSGFIGWKNMNYVILYTAQEKPNHNSLPVFETWAGAEKREDT